MFIYKGIDDLLYDKNEFIEDKFDRRGKLIYKGYYYLFQPLSIRYDKIPMYYRTKPLSVKPKYIEISNLISYIEKDNKSKNIDNKNNNIEETFIISINKIVNIWDQYINIQNNKILLVAINYELSRVKDTNVIKLFKFIILNKKNNLDKIYNIMFKDSGYFTNNSFIYKNIRYVLNVEKNLWSEKQY